MAKQNVSQGTTHRGTQRHRATPSDSFKGNHLPHDTAQRGTIYQRQGVVRNRLPAIRLYKEPLTSDTASQGTTYPVTQRHNQENLNPDYISVRVNY